MGKAEADLDQLLRSAASAPAEVVASELPFGFETRVVALWRAAQANDPRELTRFVRRIAVVAALVTLVASAATYRQINEDAEIGEALTNDYAIADTAIETELLQ